MRRTIVTIQVTLVFALSIASGSGAEPKAAKKKRAMAAPTVIGAISENGGHLISRKAVGKDKFVLHGLQVWVGAPNWVKESTVFKNGVLEKRTQYYPNGRTFREQLRQPNGDGHEIVYTAEREKVIAKSVIVASGEDIGPITMQDQLSRGIVKANKRWSGQFLTWESIPMGFGERLVVQTYREGKVVDSKPFPVEELKLPPHPEQNGGAWPWKWEYDYPYWGGPSVWPEAA